MPDELVRSRRRSVLDRNATAHPRDRCVHRRHRSQRARVTFKTVSGIPRHVEIDTASSAVPELYVKKEKIEGFRAPLESSYDAINAEIVAKMKALL